MPVCSTKEGRPMRKKPQQSPPPQGNRKNIPKEVHRRASVVARTLMQIPVKQVKSVK